MANDLNFDELDKAVNNYMQQRPAAAPATPSPVVTSEPTMPAPSMATSPAAVPTPSPIAVPASSPVVTADTTLHSELPRMQLRPRQTLTPANRSSHTFHDIISPRKAVTPKRLTPMNDVTSPLNPETAPKPADTLPAAPASPSTISDVVRPKPVTLLTPSSSSTPDDETEPPMATSQAELIKEAIPPVADSAESIPVTVTPPKPASEAPMASPQKGAFDDLSEALREDLKKVNATQDEDEPAQEVEAPATPMAGIELQPDTEEPGFIVKEGQPADAAETKPSVLSQSGPTAHDGLLDPGPDEQTAYGVGAMGAAAAVTAPDAEHLLPTGDTAPATTSPMQLFDTTEYHTPIVGSNTAVSLKSNNRIVGLVVIVIGVAVVIAAGIAVYMFYLKN